MFCGECGTKNETGAQFCEKCGAKLEVEKAPRKTSAKTANKESFSTKIKNMSNKQKIIWGTVIVLVVALIIAYSVISNKLSPKAIAKDYFLAAVNMDAEKLYQYMDVEKSEFTSKSMFIKLFEAKYDEDDITKLANYSIGKVEKDPSGLSATVTITYVESGDTDSDTVKVKLLKQKGKKYFIFDDWRISGSMLPMETVKDFQIKVFKDSKIKIEGKEVSSKYIDKDASDETYDVYKMPAMFNTGYHAVITLPMGFDVEETIRVSSYSNYTYSLSENNLPDTVKTQLADLAKTSLQALYDGAREQKEFSEIKSSFEYEGANLSDLEKSYNSLKSGLANTGLTNMSFTEVKLSSFTSGSTYRIYVQTKYNYTINYKSGGEEKSHDSNSSDSMYVYMTYSNGAFHVVDAGSMTTYFSRYN